ncbi:MAG: RnfABCDGE type electron transport complex subunit D [Oscillospiraceae bacterium]
MKFKTQNPPHIRSRESNQTMMAEAMIAVLPLYAMAAYYYGIRALFLGAVSVLTCVLTDLVCLLVGRRVPNIRDYSAAMTGMMIPLLMPASVQWEIVAAAGIFAIAVAKHPFGGVGQNVFNPAAAGVAFSMICWPKSLFSYPMPFDTLPIAIDETVRLVSSPARTLALGGVPAIDLRDMLVGNAPGPMGATSILVLMTCLLFLTVRRIASMPMTLSFLAGAAGVAALFPRASMDATESVCYELMSGLMLIGAVFLLNDPVSSPKRRGPRLLYGLLAGIVSMVFRHIGQFEESLLFAVLVMNSAVWIIDLWGEQIAHARRRKQSEAKQDTEIQASAAENLGGIQE